MIPLVRPLKPELRRWTRIGAAKPFPFRVAHASRVLVAASRRNELFAPSRIGRAEPEPRVKFAEAGRLSQQPGRLRYPDKGTPSALRFGVRVKAFTLSEMMIAMACASFILAALIVAEVTLLKTFDASDRYTRSQMTAERVLDWLGADLRAAFWVTGTNGSKAAVFLETPSGTRTPFISGSLAFVVGGSNLIIAQAGYYRSNLSSDSSYRSTCPLVSPDGNNVVYGTATGGSNAAVLVRYKLAWRAEYGSNCIVREELPPTTGAAPFTSRPIATQMDNLAVSLRLTGTSAAPRSHPVFTSSVWFVPSFSKRSGVTAAAYAASPGAPGRIVTENTVMLRNPQ